MARLTWGADPHDEAAAIETLFHGRAVGMASGAGELVLQANAELLRILGRPEPTEPVALPWRAVLAPEHRERAAELMLAAQADGSAGMLSDVVRPDGHRVPVLVVVAVTSLSPLRWVALVVDLSRDEQLARLASAEAAIVSTLLEDAPVGFAYFDRELRFVRLNRELAAMNGLPVDAHLGVKVFDLLPQLREAAEDVLLGVLRTGEPVRDVEVVGQTEADPGVEHIWRESFFPVRAPGGPVQGVAAIARDETRERHLQHRLAQTLERQHTALRSMQESLLPSRLADVPGHRLAAAYRPASEDVKLGGDWYAAVPAPDGRVFLCVVDTVGHGLTAIGGMAKVSTAALAFISEGHGPAEVLSRMNDLLVRGDPRTMATAVVVALDPATGELEHASAGHPRPVLAGPGRPAALLPAPTGAMLGVLDGDLREQGTRTHLLPPGGALVLFTDGVVERRGEGWGDRVEALLAVADRASGASAQELVDAVMDRVLGRDSADDACVLVVTRDG